MDWKLVLVGSMVALCLAFGLFREQAAEPGFELTVLHTNDIHSHYESFQPWNEPVQGGVARLATAVAGVRNEVDHALLVDAGDQFQGTLYFNVGKAQVVADVMNALGYDAMCPGNHEFDAGPGELARLADAVGFPIVSANVDSTDEPALAGRLVPYTVVTLSGEEVGILGLTTEHTESSSNPGDRVRFEDARTSAARAVEALEAQGIDRIIALTHLGYERDLAVAASVSGIDILVGGHSHTRLGADEDAAGPYPTVISSPRGEPVVVVTAYEWGRQLGRLDVTFDALGRVAEVAGNLVAIDESIEEDPAVTQILARYAVDIEALKATAVGTTDVDLLGERTPVRTGETNLGNLICDAMVWKTTALGAQAAMQNGGGIRASIPAGEITMGNVLEVLPFGNQITTVSLTGRQLKAALENGVGGVEGEAGCFPHVSRLRYSYDPSSDPGQRIRSVALWDEEIAGYRPVVETETITLATNTFLAGGGDGYQALAEAAQRYDTGWLLSDVLAEYLDSMSPVAPALEGRIEAVSSLE